MNLNYIILGGVAFVLILVIILEILKRKKGSIEIILEKYSYLAGEIIKGKLVLKLKKPVKSKQLIIGLRCEKIQKNYSKDRKTNTENEDVLFDFNQSIDKEKQYAPSEYPYDFSLTIPLNVSPQLEGVAETLINSVQALTGQSSSIKWYLYAELQCEGVNLYRRIQINIL